MVKEKEVLFLLFARGAYSVAQMRQNLIGILNGDIRLFLQPSQVLGREATRFTWRRENPEIQCHLAFFLISFSFCPKITEADIVPGYQTDHSMITFRVSTAQNPRGPGFWKLKTHH